MKGTGIVLILVGRMCLLNRKVDQRTGEASALNHTKGTEEPQQRGVRIETRSFEEEPFEQTSIPPPSISICISISTKDIGIRAKQRQNDGPLGMGFDDGATPDFGTRDITGILPEEM